jgi:hypothetical protein
MLKIKEKLVWLIKMVVRRGDYKNSLEKAEMW